MSDCKCEGCGNGLNAVLSKQNELMKKYGWLMHFVIRDEQCPFGINIHTHGFPEKFNHPDMQICAPISPGAAQGIMNNIVRRLQKQEVFKANKKYKNIIEGFPVLIRSAREDDREVLRIVLPDRHGHFNSDFSKSQVKDISRLN
ncbi:MAG: DUF4262 domain-containing protein [Bacteroidia bacterium]